MLKELVGETPGQEPRYSTEGEFYSVGPEIKNPMTRKALERRIEGCKRVLELATTQAVIKHQDILFSQLLDRKLIGVVLRALRENGKLKKHGLPNKSYYIPTPLAYEDLGIPHPQYYINEDMLEEYSLGYLDLRILLLGTNGKRLSSTQIASDLGISTSPVRTHLRDLVKKGFLAKPRHISQISPGSYYELTPKSFELLAIEE